MRLVVLIFAYFTICQMLAIAYPIIQKALCKSHLTVRNGSDTRKNYIIKLTSTMVTLGQYFLFILFINSKI